jgi:hypothetical protein
VATAANEVESIRRQMAQIRMDLHHDARGVVAGAEAATDWRHYVRLYPWAALAAAAILGFVVVPRRRRSIRATAEAAATAAVDKVKDVVAGTTPEPVKQKEREAGLIGLTVGFLGPVLLRAAQGYAAQYIEGLITRQDGLGRPPAHPPATGRPGSHHPDATGRRP